MTTRPNRFHLSLNVVPDRLEEMEQFYAALFGTAPAKRKPGYVKFDLAQRGTQLFTDEALQPARTRITAAGLPIREEPEVDCCYATQNKFWVTDPAGRQVEVFPTLRRI